MVGILHLPPFLVYMFCIGFVYVDVFFFFGLFADPDVFAYLVIKSYYIHIPNYLLPTLSVYAVD